MASTGCQPRVLRTNYGRGASNGGSLYRRFVEAIGGYVRSVHKACACSPQGNSPRVNASPV